MEEKRYLKWYNKVGYGSGDVAGNVVYAFLSTFVMLYLTNTVGLNPGIVGTLIAVSKLFDGVTDIFFGSMIDKTKTKMGKAMRAVSVDSDAAQLMGINVNRTISFTFALGSALAGAAGVLIALYYNSLEPLMGMTPGLKSFVAAVLGGIGIIPGAALGGFVIGLLETFATAFGMSDFRDAIVYGILILILLVRPAGILGKNVKEKV